MYQPLAPDPLPPGPRVTNPLAPLLRLLLRLFNVALAALGLLLIGAALWMGQSYHSGGDAPQPPSPEPSAQPAGLALSAAGAAAAAALAAAAGGGLAWHDTATASFPWFIYLVGCTGGYAFATALCGLAGVKRDRRLQLGAYILLLALLVLGEAAAVLLLLTDNAWRARIPDDPSGRWRQAQQALADNPRTARLAAVGLLGAELLALAGACALQAINQQAYDAWMDDREEQAERAQAAMNAAVAQTYGGMAGARSGRWKRYGLEPSLIEATANAARQTTAVLQPGAAS
jgi:hypothetical protein